MPVIDREKIKQLSVAEKLDLIDYIWESIPEVPRKEEIPQSHLDELERRWNDYKAGEVESVDWETIKEEFQRERDLQKGRG